MFCFVPFAIFVGLVCFSFFFSHRFTQIDTDLVFFVLLGFVCDFFGLHLF